MCEAGGVCDVSFEGLGERALFSNSARTTTRVLVCEMRLEGFCW